MNYRFYIFIFFVFNHATTCTGQQIIRSFEELVAYSKEGTSWYRDGQILLNQIQGEKIIDIYDLLQPQGGFTTKFTNNTQLPVSLIPSEILGGTVGSYEEVAFGLQYVTDINVYAEIQILNLSGWEKLKQQRIDESLQKVKNQVSFKEWQEQLIEVYYQIVHFQKQVENMKQNLLIADTLYQLTQIKYENGLVNPQAVDQSEINQLGVKAAIQELEYQLKQYYLLLKVYCNWPADKEVFIQENLVSDNEYETAPVKRNLLLVENAQIQLERQKKKLHQINKSFLPTLSLFANYTIQGNNEQFNIFSEEANWINSNGVGLKLSLPIPNANQLRRKSEAKHKFQLFENEYQQQLSQVDIAAQQLQNEYQQALNQLEAKNQVWQLWQDIYKKNFLNYKEGLIDLSEVIGSYKAKINSNFEYTTASVDCMLVKAKIRIHNTIQ